MDDPMNPGMPASPGQGGPGSMPPPPPGGVPPPPPVGGPMGGPAGAPHEEVLEVLARLEEKIDKIASKLGA